MKITEYYLPDPKETLKTLLDQKYEKVELSKDYIARLFEKHLNPKPFLEPSVHKESYQSSRHKLHTKMTIHLDTKHQFFKTPADFTRLDPDKNPGAIVVYKK